MTDELIELVQYCNQYKVVKHPLEWHPASQKVCVSVSWLGTMRGNTHKRWQTLLAAAFTLCTFVPMMRQIQTPLQEHLVAFVASILVILITLHP